MANEATAMLGRAFGRLTVVAEAPRASRGDRRWSCSCSCGGFKVVCGYSLRRGSTRSCGMCNGLQLSGMRFGKLTVVRRAKTDRTDRKRTNTWWECACDCGTNALVRGYILKSGKTISCGCEIKAGQQRYMGSKFPGAFCYLVQIEPGGPIKIGAAVDVARRMQQIKVDCPMPLRILAVFEDGYATEARLHEQFRDARLSGEWYRPVWQLRALDLSRNDWATEVQRAW